MVGQIERDLDGILGDVIACVLDHLDGGFLAFGARVGCTLRCLLGSYSKSGIGEVDFAYIWFLYPIGFYHSV